MKRKALRLMVECYRKGGKVLVAGNGGSCADSMHFVAELVGRLGRERRGIAAECLCADPVTLTAIANDYGYEKTFSRQIESKAKPEDVVFLISTSGRSRNIVFALTEAHAMGVKTILLTGGLENNPAAQLADITISQPGSSSAFIQERHIRVIHWLCRELENALVFKV